MDYIRRQNARTQWAPARKPRGMLRVNAIHVSENSQTRRTHVAFLPAREHGSSRTERFALPASVPATGHVLRRWRAKNVEHTRLASEVLRCQEVLEDGRCGA